MYNAYNIRLGMVSSTPLESYKDMFRETVRNQMSNATNYYTIKKMNRTTGVFEDKNVRLINTYVDSENKNTDDYFKILFEDFNEVNYLGDIFEFSDYRWMTTKTDVVKSLGNSVEIQRCNLQLNFTASTPLTSGIISIDGIAESKIFNADSNVYMTLPQSEMLVKIPTSDNAKLIRYAPQETRFLLGNPLQAWKVINIDSITEVRRIVDDDTNGYIIVRLRQTGIDNSRDNLIDKVAWQPYFR